MPLCKGAVERKVVCYVVLRTGDGGYFHVGSPGNTAEVHRFVDTLETGRTYEFPGSFIEFEREQQQRSSAK
jgi:hypothetical protein